VPTLLGVPAEQLAAERQFLFGELVGEGHPSAGRTGEVPAVHQRLDGPHVHHHRAG
jgi:hypothetical protein